MGIVVRRNWWPLIRDKRRLGALEMGNVWFCSCKKPWLELGRTVGFDEKKLLIVIRKLAKNRLYKAGLNRETDRLKREGVRDKLLQDSVMIWTLEGRLGHNNCRLYKIKWNYS